MWIYHVVLFYPAQDGGCGIGARPLILCAGSRLVMGGLGGGVRRPASAGFLERPSSAMLSGCKK